MAKSNYKAVRTVTDKVTIKGRLNTDNTITTIIDDNDIVLDINKDFFGHFLDKDVSMTISLTNEDEIPQEVSYDDLEDDLK